MYCKNCGTNVPDGNPFCPTCGNQMPAPAQTAQTCPACGAAVTPGVKFCGTCGATVAQSQPVQTQPSADPYAGGYNAGGYDASPYTTPNADSNKKTLIIIGAAVAVIAVIAVILVLVLSGGSGSKGKSSGSSGDPEAVAEDFMDCLFSGDLDEMLSLLPEDVAEEAEREFEDYAEMFEDAYAEMEEYGVEVSVKATDSESVDDDELEEIQEMYEDSFDIEVTDAQTVELEMTAEMDGDEETVEVSLVVIEVDGDWYVEASSLADVFNDLT